MRDVFDLEVMFYPIHLHFFDFFGGSAGTAIIKLCELELFIEPWCAWDYRIGPCVSSGERRELRSYDIQIGDPVGASN